MRNYQMSVLCILIASMVGCVSGPKNDGRTFAEKMNGENYESTNVVMGVPVLDRKPVNRKFAGKVFCGEGVAVTPANHALVTLMQENAIVASTSSNPDGRYSVSAPMEPEKFYALSAKANCGEFSRVIPKDRKELSVEEDIYLRK